MVSGYRVLDNMDILILGLAAGGGMFTQDVIGVLTVQAEARNSWWKAGLFDTLGWFAWFLSASIAINTVGGKALAPKIAVIACITFANFFGTGLGVMLGKRFIKSDKP
jgi:hypothetical protein